MSTFIRYRQEWYPVFVGPKKGAFIVYRAPREGKAYIKSLSAARQEENAQYDIDLHELDKHAVPTVAELYESHLFFPKVPRPRLFPHPLKKKMSTSMQIRLFPYKLAPANEYDVLLVWDHFIYGLASSKARNMVMFTDPIRTQMSLLGLPAPAANVASSDTANSWLKQMPAGTTEAVLFRGYWIFQIVTKEKDVYSKRAGKLLKTLSEILLAPLSHTESAFVYGCGTSLAFNAVPKVDIMMRHKEKVWAVRQANKWYEFHPHYVAYQKSYAKDYYIIENIAPYRIHDALRAPAQLLVSSSLKKRKNRASSKVYKSISFPPSS